MASMSRTARPRRRSGFTIVELMASMVVVAIVLPSIVQGTILCMDLSVNSRMQAQAASLAQAKLAELASTLSLDQAMQSGNFGTQWPQYEWMATVQSWEDSRLVELDVSVLWVLHDREHAVTVSTLVYDTASTQTGDSGLTGE